MEKISDKFRNTVIILKSDLQNKGDFLPFLVLSFPFSPSLHLLL